MQPRPDRLSFAAPLLAVSLLALLSSPMGARASVVTLVAARDNTLFEDANGDTSNGTGPAFFAGKNNQNRIRRAVLFFDIAAGVPAGVRVDSVTLTLVVSSAPDAVSRTFSIHRVLQDWGEGTSYSLGGGGDSAATGDATWLHTFFPSQFWTAAGGDFDPVVSGSGPAGDVGTYTWTGAGLTADVRSWLEQPSANFGWLIQGEEAVTRSVRAFDSREAVTPANRPALTVYYSISTSVEPTTWGKIKGIYR